MPVELLSNLSRNLITRRRFLTLALIAAPSIYLANTVVLEQTRLRVTRSDLHLPAAPCKLVHISDLHHRGDISFAENIITAVHKEQPDFVCFSGDLIDTSDQLAEALEIIQAIGFPVFGVPGRRQESSRVT